MTSTPGHNPNGPKNNTRLNGPNEGNLAFTQIMDVNLLRRFIMTPDKFGHKSSDIEKFIFLAFCASAEHPKPSPYATRASVLAQTAPGLNRLDLDLQLNLHALAGPCHLQALLHVSPGHLQGF